MRKPIYLAIVGVSIVVAAVSLGLSLTRYINLLAYSPKGPVRASSSPAGSGVPAAPPEEWNNLFAPGDGMTLASRLPAVDPTAPSQAPRTNFVLVGTIVSSSPSARRAVLWADGMKEPKAFRVKEEVEPGAFLSLVEREEAWITRGGEREKLEILPVGSRALAKGTRAGSVRTTQPSPEGTQGVAPNVDSSDDPKGEEDLSVRELRRRARRSRR